MMCGEKAMCVRVDVKHIKPEFLDGSYTEKVEKEPEVLRLYVWENVLCDTFCGVAFTLAYNEDEARQSVWKAYIRNQSWRKKTKFPITEFEKYLVNKEGNYVPPKVYDAPMALVLEGAA
jgi:hypothetical protein